MKAKTMRLYSVFTGILVCGLAVPLQLHAAPTTLTYVHDHHLFTISVPKRWKIEAERWYYRGVPAVPPARVLRLSEQERSKAGWTTSKENVWSRNAIIETVREKVAASLDRTAGSVTISRNASGAIVFTGTGFTGRTVDLYRTADLTLVALEEDVGTIDLPILVTPAEVHVDDPELSAMGIREVVTIGESAFTKSPVNRRHNIRVGVSRFNGHLIPQGSTFSFGDVLGPVNGSTGYRKELVIQGDETLPDYGGGLCQVSTTAYRGAWEFGLPIVQRKNHSYAVSYYSPQGTDATVYPPRVDLKFKNDTPGALLMQSFVTDNDRAYFIYYGTKDGRKTDIAGPFISNRVQAPTEEKISHTTDLAPGERRKAGERHDGMNVLWYRSVQKEGTGATLERVFSHYEARPLYWQVGIEPEEMAALTDGERSLPPSWIESKP